jgi:O-antigen/teichoic acid export membrane protein
VSNALINRVARANSKNDKKYIISEITNTIFILTILSIVIFIALVLAITVYSNNIFFLDKGEFYKDELIKSIFILIAAYIIGSPFSVVQKIQISMQLTYLTNIWQILSTTLSLITVFILIEFEKDIIWLVGGYFFSQAIVNILNYVYFFKYKFIGLKPKLGMIEKEICIKILSSGSSFFLLQLVGFIMYSSDSMMIGWLVGLDQIAEYSILERLFSIISVLIGIILAPLWPAYRDAYLKHDILWIENTFKKYTLVIIIISIVLSLFLYGFIGPIQKFWIKKEINISFMLAIGFMLWKVVESFGNSCAALLNGVNMINFQLKLAILSAISAIFLKFTLIEKFGVSGVVWGTLISYFIFVAWPYLLKIRSIFNSENKVDYV